MRLVKLEIKGFKSFANQTVLHFNEDVIGVVGPNGSGKSNIVDAIRWVLGEQKKGELRLDKMSSVIFNGTKKKKAGNVAQVFLTFDNDKGVLRSEFQQITIGRLLYRNGDSEYRLNGVPCRRKDVMDLFVDTGIESNSYAIIALGMVDDILADKDNSRLRMLEQAAGISVYKVRKKETLNRLNRTQEDLDRVEDLLHEIEGNLKNLEKQARRTKKYFEIKETYRELSLDYAFVSSRELREQSDKIIKELTEAENGFQGRSKELEELEAKVETTKEDQLTDESHLADQRRQLGVVVGKLRGATNEKQLAEQKIAYLTQSRDKLGVQRERMLEERERLIKEVESFTTRHADSQVEMTGFTSTFEEKKESYNVVQLSAENLRTDVREKAIAVQQAERDLLELDKQAAMLQGQVEAQQREASNRARRIEAEDGRRVEAQATVEQATARLDVLRAQLEKAEDEESRRVVDEQRMRDELDELAPQLRQFQNEQQQKENELSLIQSMLNRLEGSPESVKYLATKQGWRDKFELLSDIVDIPKEYRASIEAVLAPFLHCFLVPDKATAAEGLRVLAEAKQAPTTILVFEGISLSAKQPAGSPPAGATPALDVVKAPKKYADLLQVLLGDVFIVPDNAALVELSDRQVAVDTTGRQVWTAASAKGGAVSKLQGKQTGRRKQAKELEASIEVLATQIQALQTKRTEVNTELQRIKSGAGKHELRQLRQRFGESERLQVSAQATLESLQQQAQARGGEDDVSKNEIDVLLQKLAGVSAARTPVQQSRDAAIAQQTTADQDSDQIAQQLSEASADYNSANMNLIQLQNKVAAFERELNFAKQQLEEVVSNLKESDQALGTDGSELSTLINKVDELTRRISDGKETKDRQQDDLNHAEKAYYEQRNALADWEKKLRIMQREQGDLTGLVTRLRERKTELSFRLENLQDRLRIEFSLNLDEAVADEREVKLSLAELEHKISKLKGKLDNYGEINPLAVEAFDAMQERYDQISGQREDITQAMDVLRETISEIDKSATDKLTEAFEAVRGHFVEVFRHLFDAEDTADMIMVDPENPLESKIEIIAKPKGKRPQTINQLSGGEKTLTATAFLFALYLIKPAPFCIFDEVDAPLDDSNVEKFNRIIKRFSKGSQFIIVTHNKLTMAAVDTIYGVYMPELGVSSVTHVDFREFEYSDNLELAG
ncbi:MAG: chromosome segregation protein SMC [Saprospiraceae bacterium]